MKIATQDDWQLLKIPIIREESGEFERLFHSEFIVDLVQLGLTEDKLSSIVDGALGTSTA